MAGYRNHFMAIIHCELRAEIFYLKLGSRRAITPAAKSPLDRGNSSRRRLDFNFV